MNVLRKYGGFVFCSLISLISAVPLEASAVVRLGETVPRAILFGLGLFAFWLAIWLLLFRVLEAMWSRDREPSANPVERSRAEVSDVLKIGALGTCAIILFILFPWVQGFAMPFCSVLALRLLLVCCLGCCIILAWAVLRLRNALKAQKRAQLTCPKEPRTLPQGKGIAASGDLRAPAAG